MRRDTRIREPGVYTGVVQIYKVDPAGATKVIVGYAASDPGKGELTYYLLDPPTTYPIDFGVGESLCFRKLDPNGLDAAGVCPWVRNFENMEIAAGRMTDAERLQDPSLFHEQSQMVQQDPPCCPLP